MVSILTHHNSYITIPFLLGVKVEQGRGKRRLKSFVQDKNMRGGGLLMDWMGRNDEGTRNMGKFRCEACFQNREQVGWDEREHVGEIKMGR